MVSDTILLAIIAGVFALMTIAANAWAKRIADAPEGGKARLSEEYGLSDSTVAELLRGSRIIAETAHDETRLAVRRNLQVIEDRFDHIERQMREGFGEIRGIMKPGAFTSLIQRIDEEEHKRLERDRRKGEALGDQS